jgi:ATP synthase protein I
VLAWQAAATLVIAAIAGLLAGAQGALSAVVGGAITISAGVVYAFVLALAPGKTAGATVVAMFRAEAAKILVIVGQLWLVLATYKDAVLPALLAAFVVTVLLFRVALLIRD